MFLLDKIPCRYIAFSMIYSSIVVHIMMRTNISVNIVAMVPTGNKTEVDTDSTTMNWNAYQRANVVVCSFWGDFVANIVGGPIVERWGPRKVITISTILTSLFTALSVPAAKYDYIAMLIVRISLGLSSGVMMPSIHLFISRWAVPLEKGKFVGAITLGTMGAFFGWSICGYVIEWFGWEWAFYVFTIIGLMWTAIWLYVGYDSPNLHPRISLREIFFINSHINTENHTKKQPPQPFKKILTSIPVWSLALLHFGAGWGAFFVISAAPSYISKALKYNISSAGVLSGIVYLSKSVSAMIFSIIGDILLSYKLVSLNALRKGSPIISHVLPGLAYLMLMKTGEDPFYYVCVIIISMAIHGAYSLNVYANGHDLTKNFVGTVNGFTGAMLTAPAIISPPLTAFFTQEEENNPEVWKPVFYLGSAVFVLTGLQFILLSSTKIQKFDTISDETVIENNKE